MNRGHSRHFRVPSTTGVRPPGGSGRTGRVMPACTPRADMRRLHRWVLGLPWVVARPGPAAMPGVRYFAVDCEPLGRRRLWLLTGSLGPVAAHGCRVHIVVPTSTSRQLVGARDAVLVAPIGVEHDLVSLLVPADRAGAAKLERMLLVGYEASLRSPPSTL
jgi:hypothetical protein